MDQHQSDIKELLSLYNSAMELKKKAEKKLIRFTNSLTEFDRKSCGNEIIDQINVVRRKIREDRQQQAEQTVRKSYAQMQNQMTESSTTLKHQLQEKELCKQIVVTLELEKIELDYKCELERKQQVINELNLQIEEVRDYNQEQILSLSQKNQQLQNIIEDLNRQISELKQGMVSFLSLALEQYQNEEFKFLQLNNSNLKNSQPLEAVKRKTHEQQQTTESIDQCQFETFNSDVKFDENFNNFDREIMLGSSNKEGDQEESPIRITSEIKNGQVESQLNDLDGVITELRQEIQILSEEKQRLLELLKEKRELENKIDLLTQTISDNDHTFSEKIQELQTINQELKASNEEKQNLLIVAKENKQQLEQTTTLLIQANQITEELKQNILQLSQQQQQLSNQIVEKDTRLHELSQQSSQEKEKITEQQQQILQLQQHQDQLQQENNNQQLEIKTLQDQLSSLLTNKSEDTNQLLQLTSNVTSIEHDLKKSQKECQSLLKEKEEYICQKIEMGKNLEELQLLKNSLSENNEKMNLEKQQLVTENQELTKLVKVKENEIVSLQQSNQNQSDEINKISIMLKELQNQLIDKEDQISHLLLFVKELEESKCQSNELLNTINQLQKVKEQKDVQVNDLANQIEDLVHLSQSKDIQRDEQTKKYKQLEAQFQLLEQQLQTSKEEQQQECNKISEYYKEELKQMQSQLQQTAENIKLKSEQQSPLRIDKVNDEKFKEQINRLNDELRINKLQVAQYSAVNSQLKQQLKELAIKLQILLKIQPNENQDLNELILIIENNLSSCQSSPSKPIKRTSMTDATKLFMNKSRSSIGSNRGSLRIATQFGLDGRGSQQIQQVLSSSASNADLDKILNDVSDQDIIQTN